MRTLNTSIMHALDLTLEELAFLAPDAAEKNIKNLAQHGYQPNPRRSFFEWISYSGPKGLSAKEAISLQLMYILANGDKPFPKIRTVETELHANEFGLRHSSYGSITLSVPSSNKVALVGTPTLSSSYMQFGIHFGRLAVGDLTAPHLMDDNLLVRASMSVEQFSLLIRGGNAIKAPTALQIVAEGLGDMPPELSPIRVNRINFQAQIQKAAKPFLDALEAIGDTLKLDLSKKASRQALAEAGGKAVVALQAVKKEISAMTVSASEEEAARVQRQFDAEISDRFAALGIENLNAVIPRLT